MTGAIEALHVYDEHNKPILSHTYAGRPLSANHLLPLYLAANAAPRPALTYLPNTATLIFKVEHANLLFLLTTSSEIEPLLALEFLHRIIDIFEDFLGAPLLSSKIEGNYDIVAQLLNETCDAGAVSTTEGNALRDLVEVEGWMGKLTGMLNLPPKPGFTGASNTQSAMQGISSLGLSQNTPALPWRRANVRHTSNELYVDIIETLSVIIAPSGRPLTAIAHGTIAFTSKISGVPDLLLTLTSPSGKHNIPTTMELPVFHPCVRLARWKSHPGELSFIPPDGRFILAGYETDLLPFTSGKATRTSANILKLPVHIGVKTSLGPAGADFEVRVLLSKMAGTNSNSSSSLSSITSSSDSRPGSLGRGASAFGQRTATSASPVLEDLVIHIPISSEVRTLADIRTSRGETSYNPGDSTLEWRIPSKETGIGAATLRATVVSAAADDEDGTDANGFSFDSADSYDYNEDKIEAYQSSTTSLVKPANAVSDLDARRIEKNKILMPNSARVSFAIKGWLPSGIKVDSLVVDKNKSRGLGDGVKPYKGVKYLCVSRGGVEIRC